MGSKPTADKFHVKSLLTSGRNATHDLYELLYFQVRRRTKNSATGIQTRVARVRAGYPNQLDAGRNMSILRDSNTRPPA